MQNPTPDSSILQTTPSELRPPFRRIDNFDGRRPDGFVELVSDEGLTCWRDAFSMKVTKSFRCSGSKESLNGKAKSRHGTVAPKQPEVRTRSPHKGLLLRKEAVSMTPRRVVCCLKGIICWQAKSTVFSDNEKSKVTRQRPVSIATSSNISHRRWVTWNPKDNRLAQLVDDESTMTNSFLKRLGVGTSCSDLKKS